MSRIVVLGSLNMDLVTTVDRLPQGGETILGGDLGLFPGGKGANQALAAARLGGDVVMVGRVGSDTFGNTLLSQLEQDGVDSTGVQRDPEFPTSCALILVERSGQNVIVVTRGANHRLGNEDLQRALRVAGPKDLLLLQQEIPSTIVGEAVAHSRAPVLLNAAPPTALDPDLLRRLAVLVANENEAAALFGGDGTVEAAEEAARRAHEAGVALAVVTLGKAGAVLCDATGTARIPAFEVTAVDTTAAGDAFVGALAVALGAGTPAREAVRLANAAGAAAATRAGAQSSLPRAADLERLFGLRWPIRRTVV